MKKKVFIAHNACLNSSYDLKVVEAGLGLKDFEIVTSPELADEILFSGCSVRQKWVDDAIDKIKKAHKLSSNAKITITGCIANTSKDAVSSRLSDKPIEYIPIRDVLKNKVGLSFDEVDATYSQNSDQNFEGEDNLEKLRKRVGPRKLALAGELDKIDREFNLNTLDTYRRITRGYVFYNEAEPSEMITVSRSCLYKCSFCNIPEGRGEYESVAFDLVLKKARFAVASGKYHIILIGDEVGNYSSLVNGGKINIIDLIESIISLNERVEVSIRYIEPKPFVKNIERLYEWALEGRIRLLYISIQSGSRYVLRKMNRGNKVDALVHNVKKFRKNTNTVFYSNWMVGFPGETENDFNQTIALIKSLDFQINVVIPFSERPNTLAFSMDKKISELKKLERVEALKSIFGEMKFDVLKEEAGKVGEDKIKVLKKLIIEAESEY